MHQRVSFKSCTTTSSLIAAAGIITLLLLIVSYAPLGADATQSVFACPYDAFIGAGGLAAGLPGGGLFGSRFGYPGGMAEIYRCPSSSWIHYYVCCEDHPFECCWRFEVWAVVSFSVLMVLLLAGGLFMAANMAFARRQ